MPDCDVEVVEIVRRINIAGADDYYPPILFFFLAPHLTPSVNVVCIVPSTERHPHIGEAHAVCYWKSNSVSSSVVSPSACLSVAA